MQRITNQNIFGDFGDYTDCYLENCIVFGDYNKIGSMFGGRIIGDFNQVGLSENVLNSGDFNKMGGSGSITAAKIYSQQLQANMMMAFGVKTFVDHRIKKEPRKMTAMEYWLFYYLRMLCKIPPDILEAIDIRNEAMQSQNFIMRESVRIKKRKNDYYKKHGSWIEKAGGYLNQFFNK